MEVNVSKYTYTNLVTVDESVYPRWYSDNMHTGPTLVVQGKPVSSQDARSVNKLVSEFGLARAALTMWRLKREGRCPGIDMWCMELGPNTKWELGRFGRWQAL
jgi:hypothetical protein